MSNTDSFIDEVSEEVRRDRMFALWKRFGPLVIGAIVVIVIGAGVMTWLDYQAGETARREGGAILAASGEEPAEAAATLESFAAGGAEAGPAALATLRAAGLYAAAGDTAKAAAAYEAAAADEAIDDALRDFAAWRAVMVGASTMDAASLAAALKPLAEGNGAYRLMALEARGVALLGAGDREGAVASLRAVTDDAATPGGLRQRAEAVLTALGANEDAAG